MKKRKYRPYRNLDTARSAVGKLVILNFEEAGPLDPINGSDLIADLETLLEAHGEFVEVPPDEVWIDGYPAPFVRVDGYGCYAGYDAEANAVFTVPMKSDGHPEAVNRAVTSVDPDETTDAFYATLVKSGVFRGRVDGDLPDDSEPLLEEPGVLIHQPDAAYRPVADAESSPDAVTVAHFIDFEAPDDLIVRETLDYMVRQALRQSSLFEGCTIIGPSTSSRRVRIITRSDRRRLMSLDFVVGDDFDRAGVQLEITAEAIGGDAA